MKKILLISNSISKKGKYLDHCFKAILKIMGNKKNILFIPFALKEWDSYEKIAKKRFAQSNIALNSIHHEKNYRKAIGKTKVIFIGGGNTFRLLKELKKHNLLGIIRKRVNAGKLIYIGTSAGVNIACPTIKTTNDMPIVEVNNLRALNLIPFQINPHFIDTNTNYRIETREERLIQFHEENSIPVVGLREGSYLTLIKGRLKLEGTTGGKLFMKGKESVEIKPNQILNLPIRKVKD